MKINVTQPRKIITKQIQGMNCGTEIHVLIFLCCYSSQFCCIDLTFNKTSKENVPIDIVFQMMFKLLLNTDGPKKKSRVFYKNVLNVRYLGVYSHSTHSIRNKYFLRITKILKIIQHPRLHPLQAC